MQNFTSLFYQPKKRKKEISKKRWSLLPLIWKIAKRICMTVGAMFIISLIFSMLTMSVLLKDVQSPTLPKDMVLLLEVDDGFSELKSKSTFMDPFPSTKPNIHDVMESIEKAKNDDRVRGIIIDMQGRGISVAHTQELRSVIEDFKTSEKFTKIYASSYGNGSNGLGLYYFASVFDEIWLQPVGHLSIAGASMELPFAKKTLDKVGVSAQFVQREEYKSAVENLTNSSMSAPNKEMMNSILDSLSQQMVKQISKDREIDPKLLKKQVDIGILTGQEAFEAKLVDRLDYADVMMSEIRKEFKDDPDDLSLEVVKLSKYGRLSKVLATPKKIKKTSHVALIYVVGTIVDQEGKGGSAGADKIAAAIRKAYRDDHIKAIVLRVDSPGGSPAASETIRRALVKAQEKGKKVIVSMGALAASGGYWISANADEVIAQPSTLTGSIGVVMGKFEASGLWRKLGINWETLQYGENAGIWSANEPFDVLEKKRLNALIDETYDAFLTRVAEGRDMTKEDVRKIARGRVWTGEQALEIGLVDKLGGINFAYDRAAEMLGVKDRHALDIIQIPRPKTPIEEFVSLLEGQVRIGQVMAKLDVMLQDFKAITQAQDYGVYNSDLEVFR